MENRAPVCRWVEDPEVFPDDEIKQVFFDDNVRRPTDWMAGKFWSCFFFAVDMYNIYIYNISYNIYSI